MLAYKSSHLYPTTVFTQPFPPPGGMNPAPVAYAGVGAAPYVCGMKVWCAPPPPPPPAVNPHVYKSVHANGADLPINGKRNWFYTG